MADQDARGDAGTMHNRGAIERSGAARADLLIQTGTCVADFAAGQVLTDHDIVVNDGCVAMVVPHGSVHIEATTVIDARDKIVIPGLINAHTHSPAAIFKGGFDRLDHPRFMWRNQGDTVGRSAEEIYLATQFAAMEMIRYGTTAVLDNYPEQNFTAADVTPAVRAYRDIGLRATLALRMFDGPYKDIYPRDGATVPPEVQRLIDHGPLAPRHTNELLELAEAVIAEHHGGNTELVNIMPASSNPLRCTAELLVGLGRIAERFDTGYHMHLLETKIQRGIALDRFGAELVPYLDALGLVNERLSCAHCIWFDRTDIDIFARRGATVVHNPVSNLRLGDGIAPVIPMVRSGVNVALGTDGLSTNDSYNLFEEAKLAAILHRCGDSAMNDWISDREALAMVTRGGAQALQQADRLGAIEVGRRADIVLLRTNDFPFVPLNDVIHQIAYCEHGSSVDTVVIEGRVVYQGGTYPTIDAEPVLQWARHAPNSIRARNHKLYELSEEIGQYV